jgi:hypothetical protein
MLPTKIRFIWPSGFRGEESKKSANQKQESPVAAMFVNRLGRNEQYPYRGPSIDASYQVSVHLAKRFQRRFLKIGQGQKKKICVFPIAWSSKLGSVASRSEFFFFFSLNLQVCSFL